MQVKKALGVAVAVAIIGSGGIYFAQNSGTGEPIEHVPDTEEVITPAEVPEPVLVSAPVLTVDIVVPEVEAGDILPVHEDTSIIIE